MRTKLILLCLIAVSIAGCVNQPLTPRQELLLTQKMFLSTVNSLQILKDAGKFNAEDVAGIGLLVNSGEEILDQWTLAVLNNRKPDVIAAFDKVLKELLEYKERGK